MPAQERPELRTLYLIYVSLVVLLILTAVGAKLPLSSFVHTLVAFGVSMTQTALIVLVYMEVHYTKGVVRVFAGAGLAWLFLQFLLTLNDYVTRSWRF